ncbi:MAG: heme A synthase [Planctomycetota bacterium]
MTDTQSASALEAQSNPSPWPGRLALWTVIAAVPLILFGGAVTTMNAGMAEDDWMFPDGHLLWLYPWAMRIRDAGVFVEHHHRELGTLVGLLSILTVIATAVSGRRLGTKVLALLGLIAVCGQGALGAFRVLNNDSGLAFFHGSLGQAVFALLAAVALVTSRKWQTVKHVPWAAEPRLYGMAVFITILVWVQATLGAVFRHNQAAHAALGGHVLVAIAVFVCVMVLSKRLKAAAQQSEVPSCAAGVLRRCALLLTIFLHSQVLLGILATMSIFMLSGKADGPETHAAELITATAHVMVGAGLLASATITALWTGGMRMSGGGQA